jgi:ribosomal protein S18 acetylase RimI-like enzyme
MNITLRKAETKDVPAILALVKELALFEKAPDAVTNTETMIMRDGFSENPAFRCIVAETNDTGEVVGMALYYWAYSTWKGRYMYLDDLYVKEKMRGSGIGKQLLEAFISDANESGAKMVKWEVLDWNEPAIEFYKSYDVAFDDEWIHCKLYF